MTSLFIADVHLCEESPQITENFLHFLHQHAREADALYILGDLFEVWIGDDHHTPLNQNIIQALKNLNDADIPVYLMQGNRDLLIGKRFCKAAGCRLLPDPTCIDLYGVPVVLTHGDLLCTKDIPYQTYRKKVRSRFTKMLFLLRSLKKRQEIAHHLRKQSKAHNINLDPALSDIAQEAVREMMQTYHARYLIHGHIHQAGMNSFPLEDQLAKRIILGTWSNKFGNALFCTPNADKSDLQFENRQIDFQHG